MSFIEWYRTLNVPYKIYVAGNHCTSIERRLITEETFSANSIIYLENKAITINGINFYGTPYVPTFGQWAFMRARHKMGVIWAQVPDDTNVLITHGPPMGILDTAEDYYHRILHVGCSAMMTRIRSLGCLTHCLFGHIHDNHNELNSGILIRDGITYSNASLVKDGDFGHLAHYGNLLEI
jgi:Icc-related predicted phosphoesterase